MSAKAYATLAASLFSLMALAQLWRAYLKLEAMVGGTAIPTAVSWIAAGILIALAAVGFTTKRE